MTALILQPVRVQAALAGLLGLLAAMLCGWGVAAGIRSSPLDRGTAGPRALPPLPTEGDHPLILQRQREDLSGQKQTLESQTRVQEKELADLSAKTTKLRQQSQQAGAMTAEQKNVESIKKNPPRWDDVTHEKLSKPEFDRLIVLWESGTDAASEQEALRILASIQSHWKMQASTAGGNAANLRKKQAADLRTLKATFDDESAKKLAALRDEKTIISPEVADRILEAVKMLLPSDLRAKPGEDFTNSVGIELVWVPEGNFWIGKTEVTERQYNFVIRDTAEESDQPKDGVRISDAKHFLSRLNEIEADDALLRENLDSRLRPADYSYDLPTVPQWKSLKARSSDLQLGGFDAEPYEWTSTTHGDGQSRVFRQSPFFPKTIRPSNPVAMDKDGAITLETTTVNSVSFKGTGGKSDTVWFGKLGFRVILTEK